MNRTEFLNALFSQFPEAEQAIDECSHGLLHCEMGDFRCLVEEKMDLGQEWFCERAFSFIEKCYINASDELENALEISFIEDLALGEHSTQRKRIIRERMTSSLLSKMVTVHEYWS